MKSFYLNRDNVTVTSLRARTIGRCAALQARSLTAPRAPNDSLSDLSIPLEIAAGLDSVFEVTLMRSKEYSDTIDLQLHILDRLRRRACAPLPVYRGRALYSA